MEREALKLALEALEETLKTLDDANTTPGGPIADTIWYGPHETLFDYLEAQITAIKQARAQPAQKPFGYVSIGNTPIFQKETPEIGRWETVYTTPPQRPWVKLTIEDCYEFAKAQLSWDELLIAAETKLKEKNNG